MTDDQTSSSPQRSLPKMVPGSAKTFTCPSCGGTITIRAVGLSINAVCQSCGSVVGVENESLTLIRDAAVRVKKTRIPLGARGSLFGTKWEVIGYTGCSGDSGVYEWAEYLLFNPYYGFRFLVEEDGHWNYVRMLRQHISGAGSAETIWLGNTKYHVFNRGDAIVKYVMGEFYWRIRVNDKSHVVDYVAPPYGLTMEESHGDIVWSQSIYLAPELVRDAFIPGANIPSPTGIAPNQPSPFASKWKSISLVVAMFTIALMVFHCITLSEATNQVIYERTLRADPGMRGQPIVADPIEIPGKIGNLEVVSYAPVNNSWVELNVSLVDMATSESDEFTQTIEYYYGWDSDGSWREGGQSTSSILSAVKGGKYRLLIEPDAGAFQRYQPVNFTVQVIRNVPVWSNFWIALSLLLTYPFYLIIRRWSFESQRWANSDYAPGVYRKQ